MNVNICSLHLFFFFISTDFFWAEPGKEIEITICKLTTMCLRYCFQPKRAYEVVAYKKKKVYMFYLVCLEYTFLYKNIFSENEPQRS